MGEMCRLHMKYRYKSLSAQIDQVEEPQAFCE